MSNKPQDERTPQAGFTSDNIAGALPEVLEAMVAAASGQATAYGDDELSARVERRLAEIFEREVDVFLVPTGTAANALCLATLCPPWGKVFLHPDSHANRDECGAPEFYTGGAKLVAVDGPAARIDPALLAPALRVKLGDVHTMQPGCVSITQASEKGSVYRLDEIAAIGEHCRAAGVRLHMDGARFANALVALGCTPSEMTWRRGVDALSFGATKNGVPCAEAIVLFDRSLAEEMGYRRKRGGHLLSKMRFLAAQLDAYLENDRWLDAARHSNAMARRLADGLGDVAGIERLAPVEANIVFCRLPQALIDGLLGEGFRFYHARWGAGVIRLVTSFATRATDVDHLLAAVRRLAG